MFRLIMVCSSGKGKTQLLVADMFYVMTLNFRDTHSNQLSMLRDILITYAAFHPDVGYAQGMNDILARFLFVFDSEVRFCSTLNHLLFFLYLLYARLERILFVLSKCEVNLK